MSDIADLEHLTISQAKCLVGRIVYGLVDTRGLFYVGQTRRPAKRFAAHLRCRHANRQLRGRITKAGDSIRVVVLHENPVNINAAELYEIKTRPGLVNLLGTDRYSEWLATRPKRSDATPRVYTSEPVPLKPWEAKGPGSESPGVWAMRKTGEGATSEIRRLINQMTDARRCAYEIQMLQELPPIIQAMRFSKWLEQTRDRMLACMEAECPN